MTPATPVLRRGDIIITAFPYTDLTGSKRRPALFLGGEPSDGDVIADQALVAVLGIDPGRYAAAERARLATVLATDGVDALIVAVKM